MGVFLLETAPIHVAAKTKAPDRMIFLVFAQEIMKRRRMGIVTETTAHLRHGLVDKRRLSFSPNLIVTAQAELG